MTTRKRLAAILGIVILASAVSQARADEEVRPLAVSGDWVAVAHSSSSISAPDMCLAANSTKKAIIRADANDLEFRVSNQEWSLPANVTGQIVIAIAGKEIDLTIDSNTDSMVSATMTRDETIALLDDMAKAGSMSVRTGKEKPYNVSLAGSNKVLSVFRTCARLKGSSGGGGNPF